MGYKRVIVLIGLSIAILASACTYSGPKLSKEEGPYTVEPELVAERMGHSDRENYAIAKVSKALTPSVVGVSAFEVVRGSALEGATVIEGVGSGVIVHESGYILTNEHVAGARSEDITIIFSDGSELEGELIWSDSTLDLAVIKVDGEGFSAAQLGDSESLIVGEPAIAIGTPLGLQFQHTVTAGIISALNRTVDIPTERGQNFLEDLIQTDASINLGNSGGPLLNIEGRVIGINTVKITSAEGMGFAIPIDVAKPILDHIVREGFFVTPYIGVVGFDREIAKFYKKVEGIQKGVYVIDIDSKGPGFNAGIRIDDIITKIENIEISNMLDLRKAIYTYKVGDSVSVQVLRGNKTHIFDVELTKKPIT